MFLSEDVRCLDPKLIKPIHGIQDSRKYRDLVISMDQEGWRGRPILVVDVSKRKPTFQALTGSHRLAAALSVGLETIPVLVVPSEVTPIVKKSRYFPKFPPGVAQDLFEADQGWLGRYIMLDQFLEDLPVPYEPWSKEGLEFLGDLGHHDMIDVISVERWPC